MWPFNRKKKPTKTYTIELTRFEGSFFFEVREGRRFLGMYQTRERAQEAVKFLLKEDYKEEIVA